MSEEKPTTPDSTSEADESKPGYLVCLGASAGGLETLEAFFSCVPSNTGATFVIVSHLSPDFKSLMPELLARHTSMAVRTAADGSELEPDTIVIIPPGKNMALQNGRLHLEAQDRTSGRVLQLPIDIFLESAANERANRTIAVILSGTGSDGSRGVRALKLAGGLVLAQIPETARFDGMPRAAIETGVVDATGNPQRLATLVMELIRKGALSEVPEQDDAHAAEILPVVDAMRVQLHEDLSFLRPSMLRRRVRRRMALLNISAIGDYADRLLSDAAEARSLRQDTLIGVTGFFRDSDAFAYLKRHLASSILRKPEDEPFRVWVPACSSGEEVYSLAMIVHEAMEANGQAREIKIFATDVDEDALARASRATYPVHAGTDIGPARLERYFSAQGDTIQAKSVLREMVIFAQHDLIRNPPFTRINLVSCRNFLIYLTPQTQESVLGSLHFALRKRGTLFLGSAEALGKLEPEFETVEARHKIFTKLRSTILPSMRLRAGTQDPMGSNRPLVLSSRDRTRDTLNRQILETLADRESQSVALITHDGAVLDIITDAANVFRVPKGRLTSDIARMIAEPLIVAITTGLQKIRRGVETDARFSVEVNEDPPRRVTVRLSNLPSPDSETQRVLLVIETMPAEGSVPTPGVSTLDADAAARFDELNSELLQTRESLQSTIEELQSANEEQQSTNEELAASNEELQSTNEELQSVNEELFTVNVEYQNKIQELAVVAADLNNLFRSINIGILFLDDDLRIRKFTPSIDQVVKLVDHDVGRSVEHFAHAIGLDFIEHAKQVIETGTPHEQERRSITGAWLMVRIVPYVTHTGRPNGVVATFIEITAIRNANEMTRVANEKLANVNKELKTQREELEEMFSIVAHDLKRPVMALDGLISIIRDDADLVARLSSVTHEGENGEESDSSLLGRAHDECTRMRRMLLDLESVSQIQNREVGYEDINLQDWLDHLVESYTDTARQKGVKVNSTCDAGKFLLARSFIEEIFTNLFENALKYGCTADNPRIDVSGRIIDNQFELNVADNGAGIAKDDQHKIFEPFRRLNPGVAAGSGIGLLAVKRLAHRLGGTIHVDSELGRGAKFVVRVPMPESDRQLGLKPRLLLVEDDVLDARSVERSIGDTYTITRAQDLEEAEQRLIQERFEAVLLDLSLPDGHGLELVKRMSSTLKIPTPVVVFTGHGDGIDISGSDGIVSGFLAKDTLDRDKLISSLDHAINSANAEYTSP